MTKAEMKQKADRSTVLVPFVLIFYNLIFYDRELDLIAMSKLSLGYWAFVRLAIWAYFGDDPPPPSAGWGWRRSPSWWGRSSEPENPKLKAAFEKVKKKNRGKPSGDDPPPK